MNKFWKLLLKPSTWIAKVLLLLVVVGFVSLDFLESLQPVKAFLDSENLSFSIGQTRISAYLMTKALITIVLFFLITGILSEFGAVSYTHLTLPTKA